MILLKLGIAIIPVLFILYIGSSWMSSYFLTGFVLGIIFHIVYLKPKRFYLILKNLPRDLSFIGKLTTVLGNALFFYYKEETIASIFSKQAVSHPNKPGILYQEQTWSFKDIDEYSNKVGNLFKSLGLKVGDNVAIYMQNRPEYVCVFIGLTKIGVKVPLINHNLTEQSLLHCINTVGAKGIIYEECLEHSMATIHGQLDKELQEMVFYIKEKNSEDSLQVTKTVGRDFESEIKNFSSLLPPPTTNLKSSDVACFIYTSGTTGLPKAVPISHLRYLAAGLGYSIGCGTHQDDILYICLPLYHVSGMVMCMGQMITRGLTVALSRKFSARGFWKDCIKHKCTVFMYIGEICRYILATPKSPSDKEHHIRIAFGNGLRRDIWPEFKTRFGINKIVECYGSTEGNIILMNTPSKIGAIGFKLMSLPWLTSFYLIKVDTESGIIERNKDGFCTEVPNGEKGVMVSRLTKDPIRKFAGYTSKEATNKKILHDVFKKGDAFFNTGDIMYMDEENYYYFSDRVGDTFRWKGENVSTTEVENIISTLLPSASSDVVVVFGVEIPHSDGRAGMAIIPLSVARDINISQFADQLRPRLPSYALPLFIRYVESIDLTGTFKLQKTRYRKEGYDPSATGGDQVFVYDKGQQAYVPFNEEKYQMMQDGTLRF